MKRFLLFTLVATMFAACVTDATEDVAVNVVTPETLTVSFEEESRIQLQEGKTVWTAGDLVSVFYLSNANQKWQFQGETGERTAQLKRVDAGSATANTSRVVVVYPFNSNYYLNHETCNVRAMLPAEQNYLADSYGLNGNIMISSSEYNQFALKSVCGWLKVQLTGKGEKVKSITLKGNNGEQVAGEIYINSVDATCVLASNSGASGDDSVAGGNLVFDDTILTEVVLNCGEGVTLSEEATAFYIALPPQTFEKGLTIDIEATDGSKISKSTSNAIAIERNTIQPMEAFGAEFPEPAQPNNEIWYTSSDGAVVTPYATDVFGANIVSNTYENGKGVIKFDSDITSIGYAAFYNCASLTSVTIPDSVISIGEGAFQDCTSLTNVTIPDGVTSIGEWAFYCCDSLTSVYYKGDLSAWCEMSFNNDYANPLYKGAKLYLNGVEATDITIPSDITEIKNYTFDGCTSLKSVTIPDSVTSIGIYAFYNCTSLTSVTIGNRVTSIRDAAFARCTSLTSVKIPDSVTSISSWAFNSCSGLTSVYISDLSVWCKISFISDCANPLNNGADLYLNGDLITELTIPSDITEIKSWAFYNCRSLTSVTIGNNVNLIGDSAFSDCNGLTSVAIGNSVTSIGGSAFYNCRGLTSVTIENGVTSIGHSAFYECSSLTSVTIPDSVTGIGVAAFAGCSSLASATIPDSVTDIGGMAFCGCISLISIYCKPTTPPTGDSTMFSYYDNGYKPIGCTIYVPTASVAAYKSARFWSEYASDIVGYDFEKGEVVEVQPNNEIWYTSLDGNIVIPTTTDGFGANIISNTYENGKGIIKFDGNVTSIGSFAFNGYTSSNIGKNLISITIPDSVISIGDGAFYGCTSLVEFKGKYAADNGLYLINNEELISYAAGSSNTEFAIPDGVTTIRYGAFYRSYNLKTIHFNNGLKVIGDHAFQRCNGLTGISIPDSVTYIGEYAFDYCTSLTNVDLGNGVESIGIAAFFGHENLESIVLPASVLSIGGDAFATNNSNNKLKSIYCYAAVPPSIGRSYLFFESTLPSGFKIYVYNDYLSAYKSSWWQHAQFIYSCGNAPSPMV